MNPRICICCGELIAELGNALSRNPNICASCSSMADGMDITMLERLDCALDECLDQAKLAESEPKPVEPPAEHIPNGL